MNRAKVTRMFVLAAWPLAWLAHASPVAASGPARTITIEQPIAVENRCVIAAAAYYNLPPEILVAVRIQEGGATGRVSRNANKTYDMGPMQINSQHRALFEAYGISEAQLTNNECANLFAGAYMLRAELTRARGDLWRAVGNYHSRTPAYHNRYRTAVAGRVRRLYKHYQPYVAYLRSQAVSLRLKYVAEGVVTETDEK